VLSLAKINRGANHLAEGETADSLASREKNSTISPRVGDNQNSRGTRHTNTRRCKQKHAVRVSLCLKTAIKAISKGEN
jgi:hypothetical protein